eukprot:157724-Prymnesium_polylepis.2
MLGVLSPPDPTSPEPASGVSSMIKLHTPREATSVPHTAHIVTEQMPAPDRAASLARTGCIAPRAFPTTVPVPRPIA